MNMDDIDSRRAWPFPAKQVQVPPVAALSAPPLSRQPEADYFEVLGWHFTSKLHRPDCNVTVLLQVREPDGVSGVWTGYWDGLDWVLCESGGHAVPGSVIAFAEAEGPSA
jgi:hypothetical protein